AVGSFLIVMPTPGLDFLPCVVQTHEPVLVQALGPQPPVERLDEPVVRGLSTPAEVQPDMVQVCPLIQHPAGKLAPVVDPDLLRPPALASDPVQDRRVTS